MALADPLPMCPGLPAAATRGAGYHGSGVEPEEEEEVEPLCDPRRAQDCIFPLDPRMAKVWQNFTDAYACYWSPTTGADYTKEAESWAALDEPKRRFLMNLLAFFAGADGVISDNITDTFAREFTAKPVLFFLQHQASMENVHNWTYALLIQAIVPHGLRERMNVYSAAHHPEHFPFIHEKRNWMKRYSNREMPLAERLVAWACAEGIFFSSAFAGIFFLKVACRDPNPFPQLMSSNWYIMRDEAKHMEAGCNIHNMLRRRCGEAAARAIITSAVEIECLFLRSIISDGVVGLSADEMAQYVRFCADYLCQQLTLDTGAPMAPIYGASNPYPWMSLQSLRPKSNFFEAHEGSYVFAQESPDAEPRGSVFEEDI